MVIRAKVYKEKMLKWYYRLENWCEGWSKILCVDEKVISL